LAVFGKPGAADGCELKVLMKDTAYTRHNGLLGEEPAAKYKAWMAKHDYDPVHDKNTPKNLSAAEKAEEAAEDAPPAAAPAAPAAACR